MYRIFLKRFIDFWVALIGLILISPLFLLLILWLCIANQGKVFFIQERPGKNRKIFRVIKFKTMNDKCDKEGKLLPDIERLTRVGKFIRSTSLDEIPQLLNVIVGQMSLIGPRPLLVKFLPLYTPEQTRRHQVRPGITGWAQVNGRNLCLLSKKFEYDVWYVDNLSFKLDLKIFFLTIKKIFLRKDIGVGENYMRDIDDLNFRKRYEKNNQ